MGYRSEIGAVISVDGWTSEPETDDIRKELLDQYRKMVGLIKLSQFYELMQQSEEDRKCIGWRSGEFFFKASQWKWYPDYDVVQAWDTLWEQMQEVDGVSGYFCRVGEETTDIDEVTFGDEPDYDAFYPASYLNANVDESIFGAGDINGEDIPQIERETV